MPAHPLPASAALRLKTSKAGTLVFPSRLRLAATMKAPRLPPRACAVLRETLNLLCWASELSSVVRKGGSRGGRTNGGRLGRGGDTMDKRRKRIQTRVLVLEKKGQV